MPEFRRSTAGPGTRASRAGVGVPLAPSPAAPAGTFPDPGGRPGVRLHLADRAAGPVQLLPEAVR
ncbi:hypothetical protein GCM10009539_53060 [Cryptosporangium japonicum]|uniref:Uncharacterized protein n=1 Tax=Cryptosporangium japonicum TaxID=80872 RepID=A0ABP3EHI2_9ACTN